AKHELEKIDKAALPKARADAKFLAHAAHEVRNNLFEFFTVSAGPSFIVVDGKLLATTQNKSQGAAVHVSRGRRKQKTTMYGAQIVLTPGAHTLEYLYVAKDRSHDSILSWRPPAVRNADVMASGVGSFKNAEVTKSEAKTNTPLFSWRIVDDLRFTGVPDLIDIRFSVSDPAEDASYTWDFGDGTSASGAALRHLFLATGDYPVTLTETRANKLRSISQRIFVHPIWSNLRLAELGPYDARLAARDFSKQPITHVWNAYRFVRAVRPERTGLHPWRAATVRALTARIDEWGPAQKAAALEIGYDAAHHRVNDYEGAKAAYRIAGDASLQLASLMLNVDGDPEAAMALLPQRRQKRKNTAAIGPVGILRAECLLALDRFDEAAALVPLPAVQGHLEGIRRRASLRHLRTLIRQPEHLGIARSELRKLLEASPWLVLDPTVNLVRIDLRLARGELKQAFHLGNRIQHLQLNEVDKPKVMGKQVEALAAVGLLSEAKGVLDRLHKAYPYSTALAIARAAYQAAE
ncbi:MAG: PKD repeat protein, partial [Rhodothermales bacterium]